MDALRKRPSRDLQPSTPSISPSELAEGQQPVRQHVVAWIEARRNSHIFLYPVSGADFLIGRGNHCQLVLESERRFVSREHALITAEGDAYSIVDLSMNGTWVNGKRLTRRAPSELHSRDRIQIEDWELTFHLAQRGDFPQQDATT